MTAIPAGHTPALPHTPSPWRASWTRVTAQVALTAAAGAWRVLVLIALLAGAHA
ncbi:hypothetical protein [Bailinhaonella thermotolerans]|uniref:hypothetical protein n=1 Tax=Bailinhaonella thermotolerans TaxID=1070861 RepID=UPI00192A5703|nr:hypothetical protein [Bailinhaonella thermotolerans]